MRRLLLSAAVIAALLCGCERESGYGSFDPTLPGYYMFQQVDESLCSELSDVMPVFAFSLYYAAQTDEEREKIHDAFFYSSRIARNGDQWRIIDADSELVIDTGGKGLSENGARWTYRYADRSDYYGQTLPAITSDAGSLTLCLPQTPERMFWTTGDFPIEAAYVYRPVSSGASVHSITLTLAGSGVTHADEIDVDFEITDPLKYNSFVSYFDKGALKLTTTNNGVTDTATATFTGEEGDTAIEYNGHKKIWYKRYGYPFRYQ